MTTADTVLAPPGLYNGRHEIYRDCRSRAARQRLRVARRLTERVGRRSNSPGAAAHKYAVCIREHGVPSFPDPRVTTTPGGGVGIAQAVPASAGLSPAFKDAQKACRGIMPAPGSGPNGDQRDKKQTLLAFAHCLRGHGMPGFPDPNPQGQLSLQTIRAAGVDLRARTFLTAAKACVGVTHGVITMAQVTEAANGGR